MNPTRLQQLKHWGLPILVALILGTTVVYGRDWWTAKTQESQNVRDLVAIINYNISTGAIKVPPSPQQQVAPVAAPAPAPVPAPPVEPPKK